MFCLVRVAQMGFSIAGLQVLNAEGATIKLVLHALCYERRGRVSQVTDYADCLTCHALRPRGSNTMKAFSHCIVLTSATIKASSFPFIDFEAQSLQLALTAYELAQSVLNL